MRMHNICLFSTGKFPLLFLYIHACMLCLFCTVSLQESEFSLEINIENWEPDAHDVFVIYEWEWVDRMPSEPELTYEKLCDDFSYTSISIVLFIASLL